MSGSKSVVDLVPIVKPRVQAFWTLSPFSPTLIPMHIAVNNYYSEQLKFFSRPWIRINAFREYWKQSICSAPCKTYVRSAPKRTMETQDPGYETQPDEFWGSDQVLWPV